MNGFFNINKPTGMSSAAVVAMMRRLTREKRIGHAGTLDPEAAGVLPVMAGKATRLFDYLVDKEKEYIAVAAFGSRTDTQDATGRILETGSQYPDTNTFLLAANDLTGEIRQVPSAFSAIKMGGKPLYLRARKGEQTDVPERIVHIEKIDLLREMPDHGFEIRVLCGRGTYIRTLCEDLGKKCGCPAHMRSLVRTRSGVFRIDDAISPEEAGKMAEAGTLAGRLLPVDYPLGHLPRTEVPGALEKKVRNGACLPFRACDGPDIPEGAVTRIYLKDLFWGIAARRGDSLVWKALIAPESGNEEGDQ